LFWNNLPDSVFQPESIALTPAIWGKTNEEVGIYSG
jgi:hypothetical protein